MRANVYRRRFAFLVMAFVFTGGNPALAEMQSDGGRLFREAHFGEAEAWCEGVLRDSTSTARQLAEAHLYMAALQIMEGDEESTEHHVRAWLALDAELELPPGLPLRLEEIREELLRERPQVGMTLSVDRPDCIAEGSSLPVDVVVEGAPEGLLETMALECGAASNPWRDERPWSGSVQFEIPQGEGIVGETLFCAVAAHAPSGATLRRQVFEVPSCPLEGDDGEGGVELDLGLEAGGSLVDDSHTDGDRERLSPAVWVGIALGAAAILATAVSLGVVFGTRPDDAFIGTVEQETPR